MTPAPRALPEGGLPFTHQPEVVDHNITARAFVAARPLVAAAATGALVFSRATGEDRILLIQRAPHDSLPLLWEVPGGACDWEDESILHGVARELWEEAGLRMSNVVRQVGKDEGFLTRRGLAVAKVTFEVEVETTQSEGGSETEALPEVVIDPNEHVRFLWATEEECRLGKATVLGTGEEKEVVDLNFTTKHQRWVILQGFKLRRGESGEGNTQE